MTSELKASQSGQVNQNTSLRNLNQPNGSQGQLNGRCFKNLNQHEEITLLFSSLLIVTNGAAACAMYILGKQIYANSKSIADCSSLLMGLIPILNLARDVPRFSKVFYKATCLKKNPETHIS